jgi:hypothetical protein
MSRKLILCSRAEGGMKGDRMEAVENRERVKLLIPKLEMKELDENEYESLLINSLTPSSFSSSAI